MLYYRKQIIRRFEDTIMADEKTILTYKGRPLMRKDNLVYYGSMADSHIVMLQILETKKVGDTDVASKVSGTVSSFKTAMKGIYSTCISRDTLDEAPFAYRGMEEMLDVVEETVHIEKILHPLYNFKAG